MCIVFILGYFTGFLGLALVVFFALQALIETATQPLSCFLAASSPGESRPPTEAEAV